MFRFPASDSLAPEPKGTRLQLSPHDLDDLCLGEPASSLDLVKACFITPGHADDSVYIYSIRILYLCHQPDIFPVLRSGYECRMKTVAFIARLALGALFLCAGCVKLVNPLAFSEAVRAFDIVGDPWVAWIALGLPILEAILGIGLMIDGFARGAAALTVGLSTGFLLVICSAMLRGLEIKCQCLGSGDVMHYPSRLLQNSLLISICVGVALLTWKTCRSSPSETSANTSR